MKRYLALDIGMKRTGVALVDDESRVATPLSLIEEEPNKTNFIDSLVELMQEWEITDLIVGNPVTLSGKEDIASENIKEISQELLQQLDASNRIDKDINLHFVDERLTSVSADRSLLASGIDTKKGKKLRDSLAAAVIAQSFIDSL